MRILVCIIVTCQKHQWIVIWWKWIHLTVADLHKKVFMNLLWSAHSLEEKCYLYRTLCLKSLTGTTNPCYFTYCCQTPLGDWRLWKKQLGRNEAWFSWSQFRSIQKPKLISGKWLPLIITGCGCRKQEITDGLCIWRWWLLFCFALQLKPTVGLLFFPWACLGYWWKVNSQLLWSQVLLGQDLA